MALVISPAAPRGLALIFSWPRLRFVLIAAVLLGLLMSRGWPTTSTLELIGRMLAIGMWLLLVFGVLEQWPARLPSWMARWVVQVIAVAAAVPLGVLMLYLVISQNDATPLWQDKMRLTGMAMLTVVGLLLTPWMAMSALMRQRDNAVRSQAIAFAEERSALERNALDARLRLLQAQVAPHFLFNTLANVRELVDVGSPQASQVLGSLIAYLRAAVPHLQDAAHTLAQELELVRAYLELMQMRMPDRLQFSLHIEDAAQSLHCPPMSLLTLVENAVRHGIDPSEEGGRIDVHVQVQQQRCRVRVIDTGIGLQGARDGLGTGLSTLRERLQLVFAGDARLSISEITPHGVAAELDFPARSIAP